MQTVNIADLKNNLSAYIEQVKGGEEILVKDRNRPVARLMPLIDEENVDSEEARLVAAGVLRLPTRKKSNQFGKGDAPNIAMADLIGVLRAERDED